MVTLRILLASAVLLLTIIGCDGSPSASTPPTATGAGQTGIGGRATAGPVCPVETTPPDPGCAARPVAGAALLIRDGTGREIARVTTAADGTFFVAVPAGVYIVEPQPVEGLLGTAPPQDATVSSGSATTITLVYDTGIRGPAVAPS